MNPWSLDVRFSINLTNFYNLYVRVGPIIDVFIDVAVFETKLDLFY